MLSLVKVKNLLKGLKERKDVEKRHTQAYHRRQLSIFFGNNQEFEEMTAQKMNTYNVVTDMSQLCPELVPYLSYA